MRYCLLLLVLLVACTQEKITDDPVPQLQKPAPVEIPDNYSNSSQNIDETNKTINITIDHAVNSTMQENVSNTTIINMTNASLFDDRCAFEAFLSCNVLRITPTGVSLEIKARTDVIDANITIEGCGTKTITLAEQLTETLEFSCDTGEPQDIYLVDMQLHHVKEYSGLIHAMIRD